MGNILDKLIWFFTGVIGSHAGHFIYQSRYADKMADIGLSESLAMVVEDMLQASLHFLDKALPLLIASRQMVLVVAGVITAMIVFFIGFKIYMKIKTDNIYALKIKEAEDILAEARTFAEDKMEENKLLKKKLIKDFKQKEQVLKNNLEKNISGYKDRIKQLEAERLELKQTAAGLMHQLKMKNKKGG